MTKKAGLTAPQKRVQDALIERGTLTVRDIQELGLDHRAAKNLVRKGFATFEEGVSKYALASSAPAPTAETAPTDAETTDDTADEQASQGTTEAEDGAEDGEPTGGLEAADGGEDQAQDGAEPIAAAPVQGSKTCLCGCGATVSKRSRFVVGHDSKLHGVVRAIDRGEKTLDDISPDQATRDYLRNVPWMSAHPKVLDALKTN